MDLSRQKTTALTSSTETETLLTIQISVAKTVSWEDSIFASRERMESHGPVHLKLTKKHAARMTNARWPNQPLTVAPGTSAKKKKEECTLLLLVPTLSQSVAKKQDKRSRWTQRASLTKLKSLV